MIVLNTTTRKLQILLAGAVSTTELPVRVSYQDYRVEDGQTSYGDDPVVTTGASAVDILAAPRSGIVRTVNEITVVNTDTAAATVTIRYNDNGTTYILLKVTLAVGDNLIYQAED